MKPNASPASGTPRTRKESKESEVVEKPVIRVHMAGSTKHPGDLLPTDIPDGTVEYWVVGKDVKQADVDLFRDQASGDLYALSVIEAGEVKKSVVLRNQWEKARLMLRRFGGGPEENPTGPEVHPKAQGQSVSLSFWVLFILAALVLYYVWDD